MVATIVGFALGDPVLRAAQRLRGDRDRRGEFVLLPLCLRAGGFFDQHHFDFRETPGRNAGKTSVSGVKLPKTGRLARAAPPCAAPIAPAGCPIQHFLRRFTFWRSAWLQPIQGLGPTQFEPCWRWSGGGLWRVGALAVASSVNGLQPRLMATSDLGMIRSAWSSFGQVPATLSAHPRALMHCYGIGASLLAIPPRPPIQEGHTPEPPCAARCIGLQTILIEHRAALPLVLAGNGGEFVYGLLAGALRSWRQRR